MQNMRAVLVAAFAIVSALLAPAGCSTSSAGVQCQAGQMLACSCNGALTGVTQCDSSGHPLACQCSSGSGSGGGGSGGGSGSSGSSGGTGSSSGGMEEGGGSSGGDASTDGAVAGDAGPG
jgi:hypothetical protein